MSASAIRTGLPQGCGAHAARRIAQGIALAVAFAWGPAVASAQPAFAALRRVVDFLRETPRLSGDWGGTRSSLEERGIRFSLFYNQYYARKGQGGADPAAYGRQSGSVDLFAQWDLDQAGVIPGGLILVQARKLWSPGVNPKIGALADPIDDADGSQAIYFHQMWYQQTSPGGKLQFRIGYLDQQSLLDRNAFANIEDRQFMNTYLDNNNAIIPLAVGAGAAVIFNANDWLSLTASVGDTEARTFDVTLDTAFDGDWDYFTYLQADLRTRLASPTGPLPGTYRVGFFLDPRDRTRFGSSQIDSLDEGFYLSLDQMLYGESEGDDQGLGVFLRYGWRPGEVNRINHFWSVGGQYQGLLEKRNRDVLGLATYSAIGSPEYRHFVDPTFDQEQGWELYYSLQLTPAIAITPAVQWIRHPMGRSAEVGTAGRQNTSVFALRSRLVF